MFSARKILGLAVTEQGVTAVLAEGSAAGRASVKTAAIPFTADVNVNQPEALGMELKRVLSEQGMGGGRCVIGLAATWIVAREKQLPPADEESLRGMLTIATEREFASGAGDLAFDYCAMNSDRGSLALLAAAPRQVMDSLLIAAQTAGLTVTAVTSSTLALASASRGDILIGGRLVLCIQPGGVELAAQTQVRGGAETMPRLLRHLPVRLGESPADLDRLNKELQRVLSLAPPPQDTQRPREIVVWDSVGLDRPSLESIGRALDLPVRICKLPDDVEGLVGSPAQLDNRFAQAAALAAGWDSSQSMDFLHSRLAPPAVSRFGRRTMQLAAAGALVLVLGLAIGVDCIVQNYRLSGAETELESLKTSSDEAKKQVDDFTFVRGWYDRRPEFLDCLKEIANAFPQEGRCWATYLRTREDMQVELSIKAVNQEAALEVLDRLKSSPRLVNVTPMFIRNTNDKSNEVSFEVLLKLRGGR
jgi:hypothetical protein